MALARSLTLIALLLFVPCAVHAKDDFNEKVWKIRVVMHEVIAKQKSMGEMAVWCSAAASIKNEDDTACRVYAENAAKAEKDVLDAIPLIKELLKQLRASPAEAVTTSHIQALEARLQELEKLPTPLYERAGYKKP